LDCKFNCHLNVREYQLPFLLAEFVHCSDHPFYEICRIYKGSTRTLHRAALRGQIPAFVCDTLKRVSHKQAAKVDYNRLRVNLTSGTIACNVRRWILCVRQLQCVWRRDTNEGFKLRTPCYSTLL